MTVAPVIRPMRVQDEVAVGRIAYLTGYFGESAARYFPARALFELVWVGPYFQGVGVGCFVAELDGRVVGYVLGAPDQASYLRGLMSVLWRRLWRVIPAPGALLPSVYYLCRAAVFAAPRVDPGLFPAHLHMNLLPEARGHRLGEGLLRAHLDELGRVGVRGVQLSTTTENGAALGLYRKWGFQVAARQQTRLWLPWLGHETMQVVLTRSVRAG